MLIRGVLSTPTLVMCGAGEKLIQYRDSGQHVFTPSLCELVVKLNVWSHLMFTSETFPYSAFNGFQCPIIVSP